MRILMVTRGVVPIAPGCGGAELAVYQLARSMALSGHAVTLVADIDPAKFAPVPELEIVQVDSKLQRLARRLPRCFASWLLQHLAGNIAAARRTVALLRSGRTFDVIHTAGNLATILISNRSDTPIVYTEHDADPWTCRYRRLHERVAHKAVYRAVNVCAFRRAQRIVPLFDELGTLMTDRWGIPATKITTIQMGFDIDIFNPTRPGMALREAVDVERYCLFVGSLEPRKGPDLLIEAMTEVDDLGCVFVGAGPLRRRLERRVNELGLKDRVVFVGPLAPLELGIVVAEAEMLVLPSVSEGLPIVIIEAMACAIPVIATRLPGPCSLVDDWETGLLVKPGDTGQLTMALRCLARDPELRQRMGASGREKVLSRLPWPVIADRYVELYRAMSGGDHEADAVIDLTAPDGSFATVKGEPDTAALG